MATVRNKYMVGNSVRLFPTMYFTDLRHESED